MKPSPRNSPAGGSDTLLLAACSAAMVTLVPVALYQAGAIRHLADPPSPIFDSERITRSKAAHPLGIPDAFLGLASFATTLTLILFARRHRVAKELLGAKLTLDASAAAFNAGRQVLVFNKLCSWCTGTAIAAGVMAYAGRDTIRHTGGLLRSKNISLVYPPSPKEAVTDHLLAKQEDCKHQGKGQQKP